MENRIAIIGIFVMKKTNIKQVNETLHEYQEFIQGRMGLPNVDNSVDVISIIIKAPQNIISELTGKIGMLKDVKCKALYSQL